MGPPPPPAMRFHSHELYFWHQAPGGMSAVDPSAFEPLPYWDTAETKRRCLNLLSAAGLLDADGGPLLHDRAKPRRATREELLRCHDAAYVDRLEGACGRGEAGDAGEACPFGPKTFDVASRAAGATIDALASVLGGGPRLGYVLPRPPGHHAERARGMGFCVFGNVALAAAAALARGLARRLAVVDIDVHHGNGTQEAFWDDPRVLFVSVHQDGCYPEPVGPDGRPRRHGALGERGGPGAPGATVNVPLPPGSGGAAYRRAFDRVVAPALRRFAAAGGLDAVLVSAGYDAGAYDPLARMCLGSDAFFDMGAALRALAEELCAGRLLAVHEGGYSPFHTPFLALRFVEGLLTGPGEDGYRNPEGLADPFQAALDVTPFLGAAGGRGLPEWQRAAVDAAAAAHGL